MSGICGFFERKGRRPQIEHLYGMVDSISWRGPDGKGYWHDSQVAMGNLLLWTTPESKKEHLPLVDSHTGLVLVCDARIDNRSELLTEFRCSLSEKESIPDSYFILEAYKKWGAECPSHLLGDYTFVIWDSARRKIFCSRDHLGARPFYFYLSDKLFVFASEIKALFAIPEIKSRINVSNIAEFLQRLPCDTSATFYKEIYRLRPASIMSVEPDDVHTNVYWEADPGHRLPVATDEEYAEEFLRIFTEAVRCRIRSAYPVGCTLSGGLDSSSVACVARNILADRGEKLHTFSAIFPGLPVEDLQKIDERPYQKLVVDMGGFVHHPFRADRLDPVANIGKQLQFYDEPFFNPNGYLGDEANRLAKENGVRVMLNGFDGDTVVSHGHERFQGLVLSGHWITFVQEIFKLAEQQGLRRMSLLKRYLFYPFLYTPVAHVWSMWKSNKDPGWDFLPLINKEFGRKWGLDKKLHTRLDIFDNPFEIHKQFLAGPLQTETLEMENRSSMSFGISPCSPFYDRRLMEFCLALPPEEKLQQGWTRFILRKSMAGIIPEKIQWRKDKGDLSAGFIRGVLRYHENELMNWLEYRNDLLDQALQKDVLKSAYKKFLAAPVNNPGYLLDLYCVMVLETWLDTFFRGQ